MKRASAVAALLLILLLAGCGDSGGSGASEPFTPTMAEVAAEWQEPPDATATLVVTGNLTSLILDTEGFVTFDERILAGGSDIPQIRKYVGILTLNEDVLQGEVSWFDDPNPSLPPLGDPTGKAQFTALFSDLNHMSGSIEFEDGTTSSFELVRGAALLPVATDERLPGIWDGGALNPDYQQFLQNPYPLGLEFDDQGVGFGSLDSTCMLDVNMTGLVERPSETSSTGKTVIQKISVQVSGCELAADYYGTAQITQPFASTKILVMYWANSNQELLYSALQPSPD